MPILLCLLKPISSTYLQDLSKSVRDQQEAIWELLSTEVAYISKLQVIKKVRSCLSHIRKRER